MYSKGCKTGCKFNCIWDGEPAPLKTMKKIRNIMNVRKRECTDNKYSLDRLFCRLLCLKTEVFQANIRFAAMSNRKATVCSSDLLFRTIWWKPC